MNKPQFAKLEATGNDFIFIDVRRAGAEKKINLRLNLNSRAAISKHLCRRNEGIGADGVVFIEKGQGVSFSWDFYNSDGSIAEMCGNAARCAVKYAIENKLTRTNTVRFNTLAGIIEGKQISKDLIEVCLSQPRFIERKKIRVGKKFILGNFINSGVPHFVIQKSLKNKDELLKASPFLRKHAEFGARGTNVTFFEVSKSGVVETITFERGVEDFTKSCGTGALAAAFVYHLKRAEKKPIRILTNGGQLEATFNSETNICSLRGPAHLVYEGELRFK